MAGLLAYIRVDVLALLSPKHWTTLRECESPLWQDVMCHLGDTQTQRIDASCSLGKHPHTHTHQLHKWLVMDGCFCKTAGKKQRVGVREDIWECLFLCASHWHHYIHSLIEMPTLNWIFLVSWLRDQGHLTINGLLFGFKPLMGNPILNKVWVMWVMLSFNESQRIGLNVPPVSSKLQYHLEMDTQKCV